MLLNAGRIRYPKDYPFPSSISGKTRDWKLCWFLLQEFGVATIPVSGKYPVPGILKGPLEHLTDSIHDHSILQQRQLSCRERLFEICCVQDTG